MIEQNRRPLTHLFDAAFFADPYPAYARLRQESPAHRVPFPDGSLAWLVLREADVRAGLTDPRLSVNKIYSTTGYKGFELPPALDANLVNLDQEDHLRLRRLVSKAFTPKRVDMLRHHVQTTVDHLADGLATQAVSDLVSDFAVRLPIGIIGDLFAVPEPDRLGFATWVSSMFAPEYPGQMGEAVDSIHHFLLDLVADRRRHPGDDLLSGLIAARDAGDKLSEDELVSLAFNILLAGTENTPHVISTGLLTLLQHPDQLTALRENPALWPEAVEELLRFAHPNLMAIRRFPTEDLEISGVPIPKGETVMLCLASAHRDPARYPVADQFNIHREDKTHLALGHGLHYCLGASLARMEVQISLSTLLSRFPSLSLSVPQEQLQWRSSFRSHALKALPIATR